MVFFATSQALATWAIVSGINNLASGVNNNNNNNNIVLQNCGTTTHTENFCLQGTCNSEGLPDTSSGSLCS